MEVTQEFIECLLGWIVICLSITSIFAWLGHIRYRLSTGRLMLSRSGVILIVLTFFFLTCLHILSYFIVITPLDH